ncbi:MAG: 3-dehydroquinate synthase, partial [Pseudomonadota bacterium]
MSKSRIDVQFQIPYRYPVLFTGGLLQADRNSNQDALDFLSSLQVSDLILDSGVVEGFEARTDQFKSLLGLDQALVVQGGEGIKEKPELLDQLHERWIDMGLDRHKQVAIVGGGAVLDAVGFAASVFHRGVGHIRFPSTVLAQNDAGVGVKNGINSLKQKNLVGCFKPPTAVINEYEILSSLNDRDFFSGYAEAVKVALIRDTDFFHWLS